MDIDDKYIKGEYTIDKFLSKFEQRPDLENLRKELKHYANELHTAMTDILKTETEAIVNLAEHLTNLHSNVSELSLPIFQLHEEIKSLYNVIKNAEKSLVVHLEKAKSINKTRNNLNMQINMKTTTLYVTNILNQQLNDDINDLAILERAVNEFSFQSGYLSELYSGDIKNDDATVNIEKTFRLLIDGIFVKSLKRNMVKSIVCCLRSYVSLSQQDKAESIYSEKIVAPVLEKIFTNKNLENHNLKLNVLYEEALHFLNGDVKNLIDIIKSNSGLKGFNFILNSYWKVSDKLLQENLPHITAPGNPELFQKRFLNTWHFLMAIVNQVDPSLIYEKSFQDHMKRFNLPVYFEIRFQQISASFETEIVQNKRAVIDCKEITSENHFFKSNVPATFWRSYNHCYHPEVFLAHLSDQFMRLSLLLLSRFLFYIDTTIKNKNEPPSEVFVVNLILDIDTLKKSLGLKDGKDIGSTMYKVLPKKLWIHMESIIKNNESNLNNTLDKLKNYLIDYKVEQSSALLKQISAIPRLYRRTNKFAPTEESSYIRETVVPIEKFYNDNKYLLRDRIENIMDICISRIGKEYMILVEDVLRSVCKTEESLRRLKSRNASTTDDSPNQRGDLSSDETKIREQIKLDVEYFVERVKPFVSEAGQATLDILIYESGRSSL